MDELWRDAKQPKLLNARFGVRVVGGVLTPKKGDIRYQSLEVRLDCART